MLFNGNFGQHMAIIAGFEHVRGERVVTLDADLQNPPEEIGKLLAAMDAGHDYVGSIRADARRTRGGAASASRAMNRLRERITRIRMTDQGCMLRAYSRDVVDAINAVQRGQHLHPGAGLHVRAQPDRSRGARTRSAHAGESKYSLYKLIRLNFDLVTGFSLVPLQLFSLFGIVLSLLSGVLFVAAARAAPRARRRGRGRLHAVRDILRSS